MWLRKKEIKYGAKLFDIPEEHVLKVCRAIRRTGISIENAQALIRSGGLHLFFTVANGRESSFENMSI